MYTTIGRVLRVTDASRYPFTAAITLVLRLGDARLVYRAPDGRIFQLDVSSDGRAGCISIGPRMLQGRECLNELARVAATARSGTIEIIQLTRQLVDLDLRNWPQSIVPGGVAEVRRAFGLAPAPRPPTPAAPRPAPAPPAPRQQVQQPRPAAPPPREQLPPTLPRLPPGYEVVGEFSPLTAAAVAVVGERLSTHVAGRTCADAVAETMAAIPGRGYIVCRSPRGTLHVIVEGKRVQAMYEPADGGPVVFGLEAFKMAARDEASEAKVYIERG